MNHCGVLKGVFIFFILLIGIVLISNPIAHSQYYCQYLDYYFYYLLSSGKYPASLLWINAFQACPYLDPYGFFNPINKNLLGYSTYSPFLTPTASAIYPFVTTFPYFNSPYMTTFPYTTLPQAVIPYARFDYPTYVYGSPDYYLSWVLLQ